MIKDRNIAQDAQIQLSKLQAMGFAGPIVGEVHWVAGSSSQAYIWLGERVDGDKLHTTIDAAINACTASRGDVIFVAPYYTESVIAAGGIDADVAGISIIGVGTGDARPILTIGKTGVTTADIDIDADDILIANLVLKAGVDSVAVLVDVNKDDFTLYNVEVQEVSSKQFLTGIDINGGEDNACDRARIIDCKITQTAAGGNQAIELGEVADGVEIKGCLIDGDWANAGIHNPTDKVLTNLVLKDNVVANRQTGDHAIELVSACTGFAIDNRLYADTLGTILDPGSLKCLGNLEVDAVDQYGVPSPYNAAASGQSLEEIGSDIIVLDAVADTIASDLVVADAIIDTIASDLLVADAIIDTIASDLVVLDGVADTIASDLLVLDSVADDIYSDTTIILSDLKAFRTAWDAFETIMSDFVVKYESDVV